MKQSLLKIIQSPITRSLGFTFFIGLTLAGLIKGLVPSFNFFILFGTCIIGQIIFFSIFYTILDWYRTNKVALVIAKSQAETIERTLGEQSINLECAYCAIINTVPIALSEENLFECFQCKQKNAVKLQFFAARITMPVARKVEVDLMKEGLPDEVDMIPGE